MSEEKWKEVADLAQWRIDGMAGKGIVQYPGVERDEGTLWAAAELTRLREENKILRNEHTEAMFNLMAKYEATLAKADEVVKAAEKAVLTLKARMKPDGTLRDLLMEELDASLRGLRENEEEDERKRVATETMNQYIERERYFDEDLPDSGKD